MKFSEKIPETKVDIGQIRKSKITSGWFEQDDFLKKTDIFSKKQKGAIFSDKNRFRTFDVSEGKTIRTKVEGYDIDYIDSELGNIFKKQKIKISKPTSKDIIDIDDIIELKVQSPKGEKIFGTQTKGTKTIVQQETDDFFSLTISPKKKIKSKFESFKDDIFKKNKKASILQTEIIDDLEEEEVISKLIQQDQKKVKSFEPKIKTEETLFKTDIDDVLSVLEKPKIKVKSKLVSPTTVLGFETFKISKKFVFDHLFKYISLAVEGELFLDYKTSLQELTQAEYGSRPVYELVGSYGPPQERIFKVKVMINEKEMGIGTGRTKKSAEQMAAHKAIDYLKKKGVEIIND